MRSSDAQCCPWPSAVVGAAAASGRPHSVSPAVRPSGSPLRRSTMDEISTAATNGHGLPTPVIVIGASAGGVQALKILLAGIPANFPAAICIVTHLSAHTPSQMAAILQPVSHLPIHDAVDGAVLESGHIYTAVADRHLMIEDGALRLTRGPKECRSRPAIDVLFRSAAASLGPRVVGVVLTGMLDRRNGRAVGHQGGPEGVRSCRRPNRRSTSRCPKALGPTWRSTHRCPSGSGRRDRSSGPKHRRCDSPEADAGRQRDRTDDRLGRQRAEGRCDATR